MCGCSIYEKSFENKSCEEGCYPEMMDEKTWNQFKKDNNIEIT